MWTPDVQQMTTAVRLQHRVPTTLNGSPVNTYVDADRPIDYCNWKGRGGTEGTHAGTLIIEDTADVVMWYRPDLNQQDRLLLHDNPELAFDIISPPDNIEQRNMYLVLKVRRAVNA